MINTPASIRQFLACRHIAVAGVSRDPKQPANYIFRKLRGTHSQVFAINPRTDRVEDGPCFASLAEVPGGVDAVVVATPPQATVDVVRQCAALGIRHVWIHRSFGQGSVSEDAVTLCRDNGIGVIVGGCPMMYVAPVDFGHRCIRWILDRTGKLPRDPEPGAGA